MTSWQKVGREKYLNDCPTCGFSKHSGQRVLGATAKLTKWSDVHLCHGPRPQVIDKHCLDQPGHSAKRFFNRIYLLFLSQVRKSKHLTFFFLRINFSDRFLFVLNKCDYNLHKSMTRRNLTKNKTVFFQICLFWLFIKLLLRKLEKILLFQKR